MMQPVGHHAMMATYGRQVIKPVLNNNRNILKYIGLQLSRPGSDLTFHIPGDVVELVVKFLTVFPYNRLPDKLIQG